MAVALIDGMVPPADSCSSTYLSVIEEVPGSGRFSQKLARSHDLIFNFKTIGFRGIFLRGLSSCKVDLEKVFCQNMPAAPSLASNHLVRWNQRLPAHLLSYSV
jgi:hypothetical protein